MPSIKAIKGTPDTCPGIFVSTAAVSELPEPDRMAELSQAYQKALEDADAKQISTLVFPSLPLAKQASRMFPAINALYKLMRDFQDSHAHPEEILTCCEDAQVLNLYIVVWNMYYAADKPSRMNDGRWD